MEKITINKCPHCHKNEKCFKCRSKSGIIPPAPLPTPIIPQSGNPPTTIEQFNNQPDPDNSQTFPSDGVERPLDLPIETLNGEIVDGTFTVTQPGNSTVSISVIMNYTLTIPFGGSQFARAQLFLRKNGNIIAAPFHILGVDPDAETTQTIIDVLNISLNNFGAQQGDVFVVSALGNTDPLGTITISPDTTFNGTTLSGN